MDRRKMYQWISALIRDKPNQDSKRRSSVLSQEVMSRYGCGYVSKTNAIFNAEDKRRLRQQVMDEFDLDPYTIKQLPDDRLKMAKYHSNEKLAAKPAGNDHLLLNSADGVLRINGLEMQLYPESISSAGLMCLNSGIRSVEHDTVVIVENLAIMSLCHDWQIPAIDSHSLWVYRGDYKTGATANACCEFIERFGDGKTVVVFSDMDPKGLEIALTFPFAKFWLGPDKASRQPLLNSRYANRTGYDEQSAAVSYLLRQSDSNLLSEPFKDLISLICNERSSFRQEQTYSNNVPLELVPIRV